MKPIVKTLIWVGAWILFAFCCSCSGESNTWRNVNITLDPENLHHITVQINSRTPVIHENGELYTVNFTTWEHQDSKELYYRLEYSGPAVVDYAWFTGYDNLVMAENGEIYADPDLEMQFESRTATSFVITGKLVPAETYEISLSEDLLD